MKKHDKRLQTDEEYVKDTWQTVKESVRQLKHDHRRNTEYKTLRSLQNNRTIFSSSTTSSINAQMEPAS